ncbi:hypothetical protein NA57DRAFT_76792 [Rhizodiscina lignyota]|uniref:Uncharacterized protein n=1 Tax=Rhizodiscina lignyota TaxID=1504668 RepID=A0A9P4M5F0_9PEZI|nr:hypothetical protein NA57DRAFT_76792 [Rhizodiscina lignyota]
MAQFTVKTNPDTDIWRKPPSANAFNSTVHALPEHTSQPLRNFQHARITVKADWAAQYDQGGILLHLSKPGLKCHGCDFNQPLKSSDHDQCKWLKTGIELYNGSTLISTVCCDNYADWSVLPVAATSTNLSEVTLELQREQDKNGKSLWLYQILPDGSGSEKKVPLREVAWMFALDDEYSIGVGAYAARPATKDDVASLGKRDGVLEVDVKGYVVDFA